jgi:hypothetical protein
MEILSFFPFHNRHIKFLYNNEEKEGVVIDSIPYKSKKRSTEFIYIPTKNMKEWKDAENRKDKSTMKSLEIKIDISNISKPSLLSNTPIE